ncbi:MAG: plasmid pRiA4b ORF-3 family protein, partial [Candidatus Dormibacteraeota bacterium]|nr:plasmid pRiA4b ORF-3 family protein [Candidatus Dormibacteraeota bacterium]
SSDGSDQISGSATGTIHQLRITLAEITPPVWRRLHVRSDTTLAQLHSQLQVTMGWQNYHLHAFEVGWERFGSGDRGDGDEAAITLGEVLAQAEGSMLYIYDFGDDWHHLIEVEKIRQPLPGATYPRCSAGSRACPPEDCGGPPGYADMLRALRARKGPRYHEIREWLGGPYDPAAFDLAAVNDELARLGGRAT